MIVKLFEYLQDNKIDVYFVGQHQGECKKPYVVLKDDGVNSSNGRVGKGYIDILFFIPENRFTKIKEFFSSKIKCKVCKFYSLIFIERNLKDRGNPVFLWRIVNEFKSIRYAGNETGIVTDNDKKALTFSIMYEKYIRLN